MLFVPEVGLCLIISCRTIINVVIGCYDQAFFHAINMDHACCFEEDGKHAFRLEAVASHYSSRKFAFRNPAGVRGFVPNLSQIKP